MEPCQHESVNWWRGPKREEISVENMKLRDDRLETLHGKAMPVTLASSGKPTSKNHLPRMSEIEVTIVGHVTGDTCVYIFKYCL